MTKWEPRFAHLASIQRRAPMSAVAVIAAACACQRGADTPPAAPRTTRATIALHSLIEESRTRAPSESADYHAPSESQRARLRVAVGLTARGTSQEPPPSFATYACGSDRRIVALRGSEPGSGIYGLRSGEAAPVLVLVPHSFWDTGTLPIGETLFEGLRARALLVNTLHRYKGAGCEPPGSDEDGRTHEACPSDMAHASDSYFAAVHEGLCAAFPSAVTLALHGFARGPQDPDLIVSAAGTRSDLSPLMRELVALYGADRVRSFPAQIQRLGGTTSVQAQFLRRFDGQMVHLEMSRELRDRLTSEPAQRDLLVRALAKWLGTEAAAGQDGAGTHLTSCVAKRGDPSIH